MDLDYRPRFSFEISEEQQTRANKLLSVYGLRKAIFSKLLDEVLDLVEKGGPMAVGAILSDSISFSDVIPSLKQTKEVTNGLRGIQEVNH